MKLVGFGDASTAGTCPTGTTLPYPDCVHEQYRAKETRVALLLVAGVVAGGAAVAIGYRSFVRKPGIEGTAAAAVAGAVVTAFAERYLLGMLSGG